MVLKLSDKRDTKAEVDAVERFVRKFILNNATHLVDWSLQGDYGGLIYNFVGIGGPDSKISPLANFYAEHPLEEVLPVLETLFRNVLKPWYAQLAYDELPLYREYDFARRLPDIIEAVEREFSISSDQERITIDGLGRFTNPVYMVKKEFPHRLEETFRSYRGFVHGDLNLRNILLDEKRNIWLIDFSEAHRGHILKDLAKLESSIKFEATELRSQEELLRMLQFERAILTPDRFQELPELPQPPEEGLRKAYYTIRMLREYADRLTLLEEDIRQYYLALLYYTMQILRYGSTGRLTKLYALLSAALICEKLL